MFGSIKSLAVRLSLGICLALGGTAANAQQLRYYTGLALGSGEFSGTECSRVASVNCSREGGFRLFGGYEWSPELSLEVGYWNFNDIWSGSDSRTGAEAFEANVSSFYFAGIRRFPLPQLYQGLSATGRLGVHRWEQNRCESTPIETSNAQLGDRIHCGEGDIDLLFGLGADYDFLYEARYVMRAGVNWTHYRVGANDIDALFASIAYRF